MASLCCRLLRGWTTVWPGLLSRPDVLSADLKGIKKAADDDLDAEALKALAPQIKSAKEQAAVMKERVQALTSKLDQVGVIYTKP